MKRVSLGLVLAMTPLLALCQVGPSSKSVGIVPGVSISIPPPWFLASRATNGIEIAFPLSGKQAESKPNEEPGSARHAITADARIAIVVEQQTSHADAVDRLAEIASEQTGRPQLLTIAGWPAIHRRFTAPLPQPGGDQDPYAATSISTTTAIAAGTLIVRFDAVLAPQARPSLAESAFEIAKRVNVLPGNPDSAKHDLETLARAIADQESSPPAPRRSEGDPGGGGPSGYSGPGTTEVQSGIGELEVAIANDGLHVVVAANSGYSYSIDGGNHFTFGGGTPCIYNVCDGDPSLAIGKSGAVYYSWIGFPTKQKGGIPPNGVTDSLSISTNNGKSFGFLSNAVVCPKSTPTVCTTPDQEHIAADRKTSSKSGKDRVYLVWRNFASGLATTPKIVCSVNGGKTWSAQTIIGSGDFPRITVGGDSFVYVVYSSGSNIKLNKFSACDSGLTPQSGFPRRVAKYSIVACPVPGLDRCDNGNTLSSQMVAVDDTNPSHVYVSFATNTAANNDNVMVYDSEDGGKTWDVPVRANKAVTGRRFMPWVCASGGIASVSWYDRRAATAASDSLTAYYRGGAKHVTPPGVLQSNPEVDVSGVNDPQCASGWPKGERSSQDASSCSGPQLAGLCRLPCALTTPPSCPGGVLGTQTPCDFKVPADCTAPETCQVWGGGAPKYGDYNGNACTPGLNGEPVPIICTAWASARPPKGITSQGKGIQIYASCNSTDSTAGPVTITYHQVGACNGYNGPYGLVEAGKNYAYVDFGIESIDNSLGTVAFHFDPKNLYIQLKLQDFFDPGMAFYTDILGPFAAVPTLVPVGDDLKYAVSAQGATIVKTTNPDGAVEANSTAYFLLYDRQPGDPPVKLVKSDAKQKSWPLTENCKTISLH